MRMIRNERGNVVAMVTISLVAMLGLAGIVVDGGMLYVAKAQMQKAANAAVLSGAQELTNTMLSVDSITNEVLQKHGENDNVDYMDVQMGDKVSVGLTDEIPLGLARMFGNDTAVVRVKATAELGVMGEARGAAPLGIDESIPLVYNQEYRLKVDSTQVDTGTFGVLALGAGGAATYEDNLRFGYQGAVALDNILDTQTGNIAGKTRNGVNERVTNCPYPAGETFHRDCPRILLVPVYRPYNYYSGQLKQVKITGFAYFYITEPMDPMATYITGVFVERAGTGFVKEAAVNKGAYAIRLTE